MTAYCTQADLVERYSAAELAQLTDETAAQAIDAAEVAKYCDEATSVIDSYVAKRYSVPLSPVPTLIRMLACAIALKLLWKGRAGKESTVYLGYTDALKQLDAIATGKATLPDETGTVAATNGSSLSVLAPAVVFTDDLLRTMPG